MMVSPAGLQERQRFGCFGVVPMGAIDHIGDHRIEAERHLPKG